MWLESEENALVRAESWTSVSGIGFIALNHAKGLEMVVNAGTQILATRGKSEISKTGITNIGV